MEEERRTVRFVREEQVEQPNQRPGVMVGDESSQAPQSEVDEDLRANDFAGKETAARLDETARDILDRKTGCAVISQTGDEVRQKDLNQTKTVFESYRSRARSYI